MSTRRKVIVTGSDSGIGRATVIAFARAGNDVGITYRSDEEAAGEVAAICEEAGATAVVRQLDAAEHDAVPGVVGEMADALGGLDVFVNNAGAELHGTVLEVDRETWQKALDVDLTGAFFACQAAARRMVDAGTAGRIVVVTSVHEHIPLKTAAPYSVAKAGAGMFVKMMALELAHTGITVNAVAPGEITTEMTGQSGVDPTEVERVGIPVGRPGHPDEIATAVVHVADPAMSYMTGASLVVDGGLTLMAAVQNQERG